MSDAMGDQVSTFGRANFENKNFVLKLIIFKVLYN
jgi:hypothetical protein